MKKIMLLAVLLLNVMILQAQGVYKFWGLTHNGGSDGLGVVFNTDATGNNFQLRHNFGITNPGANPDQTELIEYNGKFYGMTPRRGRNDKGVIFEWDPAANLYTKKIDFDGANGSGPRGGLVFNDGKFYGVTYQGGNFNEGVIFEWDLVTNNYTKKIDLHGAEGRSPAGSLVWNAGKFYGLTQEGGSNDLGVIFEWDPATNLYTKKIDLNSAEGRTPTGNLVLSEGKFYGMTFGGGINDEGVIFEWNPVTNLYTKKIDLRMADGRYPKGSLTLNGSKFYGITAQGGSSDEGVIFEWDPVSNLYVKKINLNITNGRYPSGSLKLEGGKFYGMTQLGGSNDKGVLFEWDPSNNQYTKKNDFVQISGSQPAGSLTFNEGRFFGMTNLGGSNNLGVIFEWDLANNVYTKKIDFNFSNGNYPNGALTFIDGKIYGMTYYGGIYDKGVIFEFDQATNLYTNKIDFDGINGGGPESSLAQYNGKLYGMTNTGGSNDKGVIFEFDPVTKIYTKKMDMSVNSGNTFYGSFTLYQGKFYGMTTSGGGSSSKIGVIFEWDPLTNVYSKRIDLGIDRRDGYLPFGNLTLMGSKFYGMTVAGGINNAGVIFEWDPATNVYTKRIDFSENIGTRPYGSLTFRKGKFYGTTSQGGNNHDQGGNGQGVIFEWDPATNVYTKRIDLDQTNGGGPIGSSLILSQEKFYSMTNVGGNYGAGVIFEWDPETNVYKKKIDFDGINGGSPYLCDLTLVPAPVAKGLPGNCASFPPVTIDNTNNNQWVSIVDELGNAIAEIKANGNNLGIVNTSMFINNGAVREDGTKKLYLDRNITITPQVQPITAVDLRLYIKSSEFEALKNALNSNGRPSGIVSIQDLVIYKIGGACAAAVSSITNAMTTTSGAWEEDHLLSASIPSFSSFYFAGKGPAECPGPEIICNADTVLNAKAGACGAVVCYKPPAVTDVCGNATITQIAGLHSGAVFPVGCTINTFVATSSSGKKDTCSFKVTVKDKEPPHITQACANPNKLWPPNHKMKAVTISYKTWDNCGAVTSSLSVSSNEPVNGTGHGDKAPDWIVLDDHHVQLRAERTGRGGGRIYTITITSTDASGNTSTEKVKVEVPHQMTGWHRDNWGDDNDGYVDGDGDYHEYEFDCTVIPNPSKNYFIIQLKSITNQKIEARLLDQNGKLISKLNTVKNQIRRFGDDLRPGVYMVEITQGEQRKTIKVIKQ